jgi:hypothetical protein
MTRTILLLVFHFALCAMASFTRVLPSGPLAPVVIPQLPRPFWSWETIPTAFHGANRSGAFTDEQIKLLSRNQMVTIEKWYTKCASQGPTQGPPSCYVEEKIEHALGRIKALNPDVTGIEYLNSMFDFQFYNLHGRMLELEAEGTQAFLRDETGKVISLCNDGNGYCNITTFDWTELKVRSLWLEAIDNATKTGNVDGIFADHSAQENIQIGAHTNGQGANQLCNGKGLGRACYNFTNDFKKSFNSWHLWMTNYSQDVLSKRTNGPVICGPSAIYGGDACDFDELRNSQKRAGRSVIEARVSGCNPTPSCLAAYLAAAEKGTYLLCMASAMPDHPWGTWKLGAPHGPAVETKPGSNVWTRTFESGANVTYDNNAKEGTYYFPGQPVPPMPPPPSPTPPPGPVPASCGKLLVNTGMDGHDRGGVEKASSAADCCALCQAGGGSAKGCTRWSWHTEQNNGCHFHTTQATPSPGKIGAFSGILSS